MPNAIIYSFEDIGSNFRLLQHAKSFASIENSHVYIIGSDYHSLPQEIENTSNISFISIVLFNPFPFFSFFLFPIRFILSIIQIIYICNSLPNINFVFCSTGNILINIIGGFIISKIKRSKLIIDVNPFKFMNSKKIYYQILKIIEINQFRIADICIVSTESMQIILKVRKIRSILIRDFPGNEFIPANHESRSEIKNRNHITEKSYLIAVPINKTCQDNHDFTNYFESVFHLLNENEIKIIFFVFGSINNQFFKQLQNKIHSMNKSKFVDFRFYPINSYNYASLMKICDLAIIFEGSKYGLDLTPEFIQAAALNLPVIVFKQGCVQELYKNFDKNAALYFSNKEDFLNIFDTIFIKKKFDIRKLHINTKSLFNWLENWNNSLLKCLD